MCGSPFFAGTGGMRRVSFITVYPHRTDYAAAGELLLWERQRNVKCKHEEGPVRGVHRFNAIFMM